MKSRDQGSANRSFRWGASPQFSRGVWLSPPTSSFRTLEPLEPRSVRRSKRERPRLIVGLLGSLLVHGLVFVSWQGGTLGGGDAGNSLLAALQASDPIEVVQLREDRPTASAASAPEVSDHPRPVPSPDPPELALQEMRASQESRTLVRAEYDGLPGVGLPALTGSGTGTGRGDGDDSGADVYVPARARTILRTWRPPASVIDSEVLIRVRTDETGRPLGPVELRQPTMHEETNREIIRRAKSLEYWPARLNGEPVASWAEISFEFCHDGVTAASPPSPGFGVGEPCAPEVADARVVVAVAEGRSR